jgi:hypothetical protein
MLFGCYEISLLDFMTFPNEISLWEFMFLLHNFLVRFPYETSCFLSLMRFPHKISYYFAVVTFSFEISCFLAVMRCYCEMCRVLLHTFWWDILMRFYAFWPLWDVLCRLYDVCCTIFAAQFLYEISWCEFMLFWVVTSFAYLISCLFGRCEMSWWDFKLFSWCDRRTVERWILKDAGEWEHTMVYWTLRGFICASWVVGESASALRDRRVCVEVGWSPARITSSRYVSLRMTLRDLNMLLW